MKILVDTDVLIDYFRGLPQAISFIKNNYERIVLSTITVAELYAGVREGEERKNLDEFIQLFESLPVDLDISQKGGLLKRDYRASHNVGLSDAMIAATAIKNELKLYTLNIKHFPMLKDVEAPYQK